MFLTKSFKLLTVFLVVISFFLQSSIISVYSSDVFDKNKVFSDGVFYSLPNHLSSPEKIQVYLESTGSLLANYKVEVSFAEGDRNLKRDVAFPNVRDDNFIPEVVLADYLGKEIPFSEFVWLITRTRFGNSCGPMGFDGRNLNSLCYDNRVNPINPAFVLALIQKESGLVYGHRARLDPNSDNARFLLDRAVGYMCLETSDRTRTCYDENPQWKFFKGVFRQVYYAMRLIRIREQTCKNPDFAFVNFRGKHLVGATLEFSGQKVTFGNALTCSLYIYTPHIIDKDLFWRVMRDVRGFDNFRRDMGINEDYHITTLEHL